MNIGERVDPQDLIDAMGRKIDREANQKHRQEVKDYAIRYLIQELDNNKYQVFSSDAVAIDVIDLIAAGKIPAVKIEY